MTSAHEAALAPGPKPVATAQRAMVVSSHPVVTATALDVLRSGGNAVDAMLTAMPLQQVLEPQLSTIAGGFAMLHWDASTGHASYLNANCDRSSAPSLRPQLGPETSGDRVAVPSTVAGMRAAADRFGTRAWTDYFAPAIAAADEGFAVYDRLHKAMVDAEKRITQYESGRARYCPDGTIPAVGAVLRQPGLATTLRRLAEPDGAEWFQRGEFADRFVEAVGDTGGTITLADLDGYRPRWDGPLRFGVGPHEVLGTPLPDVGGLQCALALGLLEALDVGAWDTSSRAVALIARAQAEAEAQVGRFAADPLAYDVPVDVLLSRDHLANTARLVSGTLLRPSPRAVGSNQLVIVDEVGNWVTMLHTGYGTDFGTGLVVDGVGVNSANLFPGVTAGPGRRIVAPLASTLVLRDGRPWFGLGTPGYPPPSITLVLHNVLNCAMTPAAAIDAPRFDFEPGSDDVIAAESGIDDATLAGLADFGISTVSLGERNAATGRVNAVHRDDDGTLTGIVDPRSAGLAAGY